MLLFLAGCDDSLEVDLLKEIDERIKLANAPVINLDIRDENGYGVTSPLGPYQIKQLVEFNLMYTISPQAKFGFYKWEARDSAGTIADIDKIFFANERSTETKVTVIADGGSFTIRPLTKRRPEVDEMYPEGLGSMVVSNHPVTIRFSKNIAPDSFIFEYNSAGAVKRKQDTNGNDIFKNISIQGRENFGENSPRPFEQYFEDPDLKGDTLRLVPKEIPGVPGNSHLVITLSENIYDTDRITMGDQVRRNYAVSREIDRTPPEVNYFVLSVDGQTVFDSDDALQHVNAGDSLYLLVSAYDEITKTSLGNVNITERRIQNESGRVVNETGRVYRGWYFDDINSSNPVKLDLIHDVQSKYSLSREGLKSIAIIEYKVQSTERGIIQLTVEVSDKYENLSKPESAPFLNFVLE
jgi:hypothetical protein